jgi:glycosyltransferase involved in cell wall biosynthesis
MSSALLVVVPAYNEAMTIATVVAEARALGDVVVVDDGSRDSTAELACAAGAAVLSLAGNTGYEGALGTGIQYAIDRNYDFALTMDADGQHRLESAQALIDALSDADIAVGIRQKKQRTAEWVASWIGALMWKVADPYSGLKLYRLATCKAFAPFDSRRLVGAEMMVRARRNGLRLVTIPIQTAERADAPRFANLLRANYRLTRATVLLVGISWGLVR